MLPLLIVSIVCLSLGLQTIRLQVVDLLEARCRYWCLLSLLQLLSLFLFRRCRYRSSFHQARGIGRNVSVLHTDWNVARLNNVSFGALNRPLIILYHFYFISLLHLFCCI